MRQLPMLVMAFFLAFAACFTLPAIAQQQRSKTPPAPASKPYTPLMVKLPRAIEDPTFDSFRNELASVAKARVYAELERLVMPQGFFWDRDFGGGFDKKKPGVDNLATAIGLERRNGAGWLTLAVFAAEKTAAPFTGRPGIICAPGEAHYDEVEFDRLLEATRSNGIEWAVPRADKIAVRSAPRATAGVTDTLGLHLVHILEFMTKEKEPETVRAAWVRIATPSGKIGFVAPGTMMTLTADRLCYGQDGFNRWRIAGYVGGGD